MNGESPSDHFSKTQPLNLRMSKGSSNHGEARPSSKLHLNYDALPTDSNLYKLSPDASNYFEEERDRLELGRLLAKHRRSQLPSLRSKPAAEGSLEATACVVIERLAEERDAAADARDQLSRVASLDPRSAKRPSRP
jgi:hypothetical protein